MTQQKTVPSWGKTVGILMIIFGSLGIFMQIYKILIPALIKFQRKMMDTMATVEFNDQPNPFKATKGLFDEYLRLTDAESNTLMISGFMGLAVCIFYIIGGAKLLKPTPTNYRFGRASAIGSLVFNIVTIVALLSSGTSLLILGILVYVVLGLLIDLTLTIIILASNKSGYGIGVSEDAELKNYTRTENDDIL